MSRETDSSSSGPQGRGAAAYPSGTPPYGTSAQGAASGDAEPTPPGDQDGPKTETTLTTRIRINIPGSRPIPPVVMRTPMSDVDGGGAGGAGAADGPQGAEPRTPQAPSADARPAASAGFPADAPQPGASAEPEAQRDEKTSDWFAPRKSAAPQRPADAGAPAPGTGAPQRGTSAGTTGGFDVSGAVAAGPLGSGAPQGATGGPSGRPGPGAQDRGDLPYFSANGNTNGNGPGSGNAPGGPDGTSRPGPSGPAGPKGPTGGPVTGDGPMFTPPSAPSAPGAPSAPNPPVGPGAGAPTPPRMSDDTAILTPQKPAPEPPAAGGNVSGDTLTSGIPVVPQPGQGAGPGSPFPPQGPGAGPTAPKLPDPVQSTPAPAKKKKGRSKLVLLGAGVVGVAGVAYGAGLLMNHSDVPKGTTVLGVDIGGGTRDEAAAKLESTLGKRTDDTLKLEVDGKTVELKPDQSGLSLDSAATVSAAAGSDYNPVSVIGSLFGNQRVVQPVMPVDAEKLHAALQDAAGGGAASGDGTIKFVPGKAVAVYGKAGKGIDVDQSADAVAEAYRAHVETGKDAPVRVATSTQQPTVTNAEVDRKMKQFAEPAMSANVTITAGGKQIDFGPAISLPKVLGMKAVDGKLVETYNLKALKELYGNTFDGVLITRGTGKKTAVQPTDVAQAMGRALLGKTKAERTVDIPTNAG
ncbi:hypothetical protein ABII15_25100 [Streptomyces sp. HUAS MG91]|uniref:Peptidoglycan binding domain-containing protein n=1 Tax=Streptomyces tabacisoli TaxID=3156398 RepID=A0AAU8IWR5_9ACTN